jgi:hypothetical protein
MWRSRPATKKTETNIRITRTKAFGREAQESWPEKKGRLLNLSRIDS